nr:prolipoprotein diacylglyceryl transferase [Nanchangia anserum]
MGPLTIHMYGIVILLGVIVAVVIAHRRYRDRGGDPNLVLDAAIVAVPAGIIGGRIYHVVTSYENYIGPGRHLGDALKIWNGGLGIWGAVALGALGAYLVVRRKARFGPFADALAPGLACAQAIGRLGNWFNQELFGAPTELAWGLRVDPAHLPAGYAPGTLFHPTFLYELLWNLALAAVLIGLERRRRLASGQVWWLYVAGYCLGRVWIEALRIDTANHILGLRLNMWTCLIIFALAAVAASRAGRANHPARIGADERAGEQREQGQTAQN